MKKILTKAIVIVLSLVMLLGTFPFYAGAIIDGTYVADIYGVVYKEKASWAYILFDTACDVCIDYDINHNVSDYYLYMGYTRSYDTADSITGIISLIYEDDREMPSEYEHNGIKYIPASGTDDNINKFDAFDWNKNAGGDYVYIYYTKDPAAGLPITDIKITDFTESPSGYTAVLDQNGNIANLSSGKKEHSPRMHYKRANSRPDSNATDLSAINGYLGDLSGYNTTGGYESIENEVNNWWGVVSNYLNYDINANVSDNFIYLGYNKTGDVEKAIRGIIITTDTPDGNNSITAGGITYRAVGGCHISSGSSYNALPFDFNGDTGGDYVYMYYTFDPKAGAPIIDFSFTESKNSKYGFEVVNNQYGNPANLKSGIAGNRKSVYMHVQRVMTSGGFVSTFYGSANRNQVDGRVMLKDIGCLCIPFDFPKGDSRYFISVGYTKTDKIDRAIRGFIVTSQAPDVRGKYTVNNIDYYPVTGFADGQELEVSVDGNIRFGQNSIFDFDQNSKDKQLYLYYTYNPKAGSPVTDITFTNATAESGYECLKDMNGNPVNFSSDAKNSGAYMHIKRDASILGSILGNGSYIALIVLVLILIGGAVAVISVKRKKNSVKADND